MHVVGEDEVRQVVSYIVHHVIPLLWFSYGFSVSVECRC
jgi:hypothetical protein